MTLAVLVLRRSYLKVLGSLIRTGLDRGHRVVILWHDGPTKPGERVAETDLAHWPGAERVRYEPGDVAAQLARLGIDALVSTELYPHIAGAGLREAFAAARRAGVRLYSVSYIFDSAWTDPDGYALIDRTCYVSEYQRELHWKLHAAGFTRIGDRATLEAASAVTGLTMLDQLAVVDPGEARRRYGLPADRPIVVLMSLKMNVPDPWRRLVWGAGPKAWRVARAVAAGRRNLVPDILHRPHYRDVVAAVRRLCDRHGALLVVKCKQKNDDPAFLQRAADLFVDDRYLWPYTSLELMAVASLCVHFESGAVIEAAFAGVPSISIAVPQGHLLDMYADIGGIDELYGGRPGSLQNYPGVVRRVTPADAVGVFDALDLRQARVEPAARASFIQKFLGFDDTKGSQRILDLMERQ